MALLQISEPDEPARREHRLAVGIDLGTTNSLVATVRNRIPVVLPDENGHPLLPSIVRYGEEGVQVGYAAQAMQSRDPGWTRMAAVADATARVMGIRPSTGCAPCGSHVCASAHAASIDVNRSGNLGGSDS